MRSKVTTPNEENQKQTPAREMLIRIYDQLLTAPSSNSSFPAHSFFFLQAATVFLCFVRPGATPDWTTQRVELRTGLVYFILLLFRFLFLLF